MDAIKLENLIGQTIIISYKLYGPPIEPTEALLLGVENGGIWIESQIVINVALSGSKSGIGERTPILFLPFSSVCFILSLRDVPCISSKIISR